MCKTLNIPEKLKNNEDTVRSLVETETFKQKLALNLDKHRDNVWRDFEGFNHGGKLTKDDPLHS
jgi:hypothetical protein